MDAASQPDLAAATVDGCEPGKGFPCFPWREDVWGHGTHVAGTLGAVRDQAGVAGVAGDRARMYMYNLFGEASDMQESDLILALDACLEELARAKAAVNPHMRMVRPGQASGGSPSALDAGRHSRAPAPSGTLCAGGMQT
jgi:subtilisin family serine protease